MQGTSTCTNTVSTHLGISKLSTLPCKHQATSDLPEKENDQNYAYKRSQKSTEAHEYLSVNEVRLVGFTKNNSNYKYKPSWESQQAKHPLPGKEEKRLQMVRYLVLVGKI